MLGIPCTSWTKHGWQRLVDSQASWQQQLICHQPLVNLCTCALGTLVISHARVGRTFLQTRDRPSRLVASPTSATDMIEHPSEQQGSGSGFVVHSHVRSRSAFCRLLSVVCRVSCVVCVEKDFCGNVVRHCFVVFVVSVTQKCRLSFGPMAATRWIPAVHHQDNSDCF